MSQNDIINALHARIVVLERREALLTSASYAYQEIITTLLGNIDPETRSRVIALVEKANEIAFSRAVSRADEQRSALIKDADEIAQQIFMFAQPQRRPPK